MRPIHVQSLASVAVLALGVGVVPTAKGQTRLENPEIVARVAQSVVTIATFDDAGTELAQGSGFVIADGRYVATNHHVMVGASTATVTFSDGEVRSVLGYVAADADRDAVVLRVEGEVGVPLALADSDSLPTGEDVIVIGAPEGFQQTVTTGVSSGNVELDGVSWLQFSALVSPGSSGSPVLDRTASVVGMVTHILPAAPQLNFATPSNVLRSMIAMSDSVMPLAGLDALVAVLFTEEQIGWLRSLPTANRVLTVGRPVAGELTNADEVSWDGTYAQAWMLAAGDAAGLHVDLISSAFDAFLMVLPSDSGAPLFDDDGGGACHSRVSIGEPARGEYIVVVNTIAEESTGEFQLLATSEPLPLVEGSCDSGALSWFRDLAADERTIGRGEEKFGTLTRRDSLWTADSTAVQAWDLVLETPGPVTVDLISQEFDAFLYVVTPTGELLSDDDTGGACNARISVENAVAGTYRVVVNTAFSSQVGAFRLRASEVPAPKIDGQCGEAGAP